MRKRKGQGVIEYSGALIVASALVATILSGGVSGMAALFQTVLTAVVSFLQGYLPLG